MSYKEDLSDMNLTLLDGAKCTCIDHIKSLLKDVEFNDTNSTFTTNDAGCGIRPLFCDTPCALHDVIKQFIQLKCSNCKNKKFIASRTLEYCYANKVSIYKHCSDWTILPIEQCFHPDAKLRADKTTYTKIIINKYDRTNKHNKLSVPEIKDAGTTQINTQSLEHVEEKPKESWLYAYARCELCDATNIAVKNCMTKNEVDEQSWSGWVVHK